jgi:hypothetical protein
MYHKRRFTAIESRNREYNVIFVLAKASEKPAEPHAFKCGGLRRVLFGLSDRIDTGIGPALVGSEVGLPNETG